MLWPCRERVGLAALVNIMTPPRIYPKYKRMLPHYHHHDYLLQQHEHELKIKENESFIIIITIITILTTAYMKILLLQPRKPNGIHSLEKAK